MIKKYGIDFSSNTSKITIELAGYSRNIIEGGDREERSKIMLECMKLLWSDRIFRVNEWTERRVRAFCSEPFFTMWGPSSAGKSTDTAAMVLVHWLSSPAETTCTVCSTTRPALVQRIFGEIVRLYGALKNPRAGILAPRLR